MFLLKVLSDYIISSINELRLNNLQILIYSLLKIGRFDFSTDKNDDFLYLINFF